MLNAKTLQKGISAVTMFATVVCLSGVSMLAPLTASAATTLVDGDIVKTNATNSDGTPAVSSLDVYIVKTVGTKKFKRLVLNPNIFASYGHLKWENLKTVTQAEIDGYTTSSLVRVDGDSKVYALTPVTGGDTGAKSWVDVTAAQFIDEADSDPDSIYTINSTDAAAYSSRASITTVTQLKAFYKDGTLPAETATGDLTVSLSASTPEANTIPIDSSAEFTAIKLAAGSEAVSINSITVTASGLGTPTNLNEVGLYIDGSKVGSTKDINSDREANFNFSDPVKISANASKTLTIRAIADLAGNYKLGIKEGADIITAGGTVGGSFPIYGNNMSADDNVDAGDVDMTNVETTDTTNSFGEDNVLLAAFDLTANDEGAIIDSLRFKNGGTNEDDIISNLKLMIDGEDIADGVYDSSTGYVDFSVDGDYMIKSGETASVEIYGDLGVASADDTIKLYIKNIGDLAFIGEDYGFGVQVNSIAALDAATDGIVVILATGDITINMDKAATPAQDVEIDTDNVVLATFEITSNGEDATLEQIVDSGANVFQIQGTGLTTGEIENVEMRDVDAGTIYDITSNFDTDHWELSMTDEISLAKGVTKTFEIRADLTSTIDVTNTLKVVIDREALTITGDDSDSSITDITPSTVTSAISTVAIASLDWTTSSLIAKTVVPGAEDVVLYQATLEAGDVDAVKLSTVTLTTNGAGVVDDFTDSNISSIDLYLGGKKINSTSPSIVESVIGTPGHITFSSLNTDAVIAAGATATLEAKATFASDLTHVASFSLEIDHASTSVIAKSKTDSDAIDETVNNVGTGSRTITVAEQGTLKVELLTSSTKADNDTLMLAGAVTSNDKYLGELKFTTANEKINLDELRLENTGTATSSTIAEVYLVDSTGAIKATKIPAADGDVTFTNLDLELAADQATSYFIAMKAKGMNVDGDASSTAVQGATVIYNISDTEGVVATGVDSGLDVALAVSADGTVIAGEWAYETTKTKTATVSGAVLNSIVNALTDGTLQGGQDKIVGKYTLVFENGSNRTTTNEELKAVLDDLTLTVSKSADVVLDDFKIYREDAPATVVSATATSVWTNALGSLADGGKVDGSVTLIVTADVTTTAADGEYIQTSIATPSTSLTFNVDGTAVANSYLGVTNLNGATLSE
jgi:hypothetical protein